MKPSFSNNNNWDLLYTGQESSYLLDGKPMPIMPFSCPVAVSIPTIAIFIETIDESPFWKFGGHVSARINSGLQVGGQVDATIGRRWLRLNQINIIRFPSLSDNYVLEFEPPKWFKLFKYTLWEYIGTGYADLEGKIDNLETLINNP